MGFGICNLTFSEYWNSTIYELFRMAKARQSWEGERFEADLDKTAWAVAHIMNSSGNYKQPITPDKLLGKDEQKDWEVVDVEEKDNALADLKARMAQAQEKQKNEGTKGEPLSLP